MALKLYNTQSGQLEEFKPLTPGRATLYACGPTVYDHAHIGHARAAVAFDLLVRHLRNSGYQVEYARNFTDVDDKIINRARETGRPWAEVADFYRQSFMEDMSALGCLIPDHQPRATEYIPQMIEDIQALVDSGYAYELEGDVYFDVPAYPPYGRLSGRDLGSLSAGARISVDERKKSPYDFALWKAAKPDEPSWPSPWGPGRPGWHIECSTMSCRLFGPVFDIHGGGQDLIFPHHENELAQSGALGRPMARIWAHNGFVRINNEKMSKSLNNFFTVKDILKKFPPEAVRFFLVSKHYRGPLDFSDDALKEAEKALDRIYRALDEAGRLLAQNPVPPPPARAVLWPEEFQKALDDDLNTSKALGLIFEAVRELNKTVGRQDSRQAAAFQQAVVKMGQWLGLLHDQPEQFWARLKELAGAGGTLGPEEIESLVAARREARRTKNWAEADRLRQILTEAGIIIEDKGDQSAWRYA